MDTAEARRRLWDRYDAGEISADEVEARLLLLEQAGDEAALRTALEGPVPLRRRASTRRTLVLAGGALGVLLLAVSAAAVISGDDGGGTTGGGGNVFGTVVVDGDSGVAVSGDIAVPRPLPAPNRTIVADPGFAEPAVDCPEDDSPVEASGELAVNPSLLSDPPHLPEGYELGSVEDIVPGSDDATMTIAAGNPQPVEIRGRTLDGELLVRMRTFRYADAEEASAAADDSRRSACSYAPAYFEVPDQPEVGGAVVSGVIPETAFASWQLGDRRFIVAVESAGDIEAAKALAGEIATAELIAART